MRQLFETRYQIILYRVTTGTWVENEFTEVGKDAGGDTKYGHRPVEKPREKREEVFRYETPHEPDVGRIVEHMEHRRRVPGV